MAAPQPLRHLPTPPVPPFNTNAAIPTSASSASLTIAGAQALQQTLRRRELQKTAFAASKAANKTSYDSRRSVAQANCLPREDVRRRGTATSDSNNNNNDWNSDGSKNNNDRMEKGKRALKQHDEITNRSTIQKGEACQ